MRRTLEEREREEHLRLKRLIAHRKGSGLAPSPRIQANRGSSSVQMMRGYSGERRSALGVPWVIFCLNVEADC